MRIDELKEHARAIFDAGVSAAAAGNAVERAVQLNEDILSIRARTYDLSKISRIHIFGAGKATADMALKVEEILGADRVDGLISVKYGHTAPLQSIRIIEAGHPVPDSAGQQAAQEVLEKALALQEGDLVLMLVSGGGSALLPLPTEGITLEEKQETTRQLLKCGATIDEINGLRKHLSLIKGGRLAKATYPATVECLMVSDVMGNRKDVIASGSCSPDATTFADCVRTICHYGLLRELPQSVLNHIEKGCAGEVPESPKPGDPMLERSYQTVIADYRCALAAAEVRARELGYNVYSGKEPVIGDTTAAAKNHANYVRKVLSSGHPVDRPACILSGGETTVEVTGDGKGGRNMEFALVAASRISGREDAVVLSAGTDGTDGPTDAAGAMADTTTVDRARKMGMDPADFLARNDSHTFFEALGDLVVTGPTNTNVMDLHVVLVG